MKRAWSVVCVAGLLFLSSAASAADLPHRKPGHWQLTTTLPMGAGKRVVDACITEKDNLAAPQQGTRDCSKPEIERTASSVTVSIVCKRNGIKETVKSTFSGDFDTSYHGDIEMTMDPPIPGMKHMAMSIDAKYIGPNCPQGAIRAPH